MLASAVQVWFMRIQEGGEGPTMELACSQEFPSPISAVATSGLHGAAICAGAAPAAVWIQC